MPFSDTLEKTNVKHALKYAKQALKLDPFNFDAGSMVMELKSTDVTKLVRDYEKAVKNATMYLFLSMTPCGAEFVPQGLFCLDREDNHGVPEGNGKGR